MEYIFHHVVQNGDRGIMIKNNALSVSSDEIRNRRVKQQIDNHPFVYTRMMQGKKTRKLEAMLCKSIKYFPELHRQRICIGYTQQYGEADTRQFLIRLNPRKLSYYVIGHELTHLVQGIKGRLLDDAIPQGEIACDIWTIARAELFLDEPPGYLDVGRSILLNWKLYRNRVRSLCIEAIQKRKIIRPYIKWLTNEIRVSAHEYDSKCARTSLS